MTTEKIETTESEVKTLSNGDTEFITETVVVETTVIPAPIEQKAAPIIEAESTKTITEKIEEETPWTKIQFQLSTLTDSLNLLTLSMATQQAQFSELLTLQAKPPENVAVPLEAEESLPVLGVQEVLDPRTETETTPETKVKKKVPEKSRRWL